MLRIFGNKSSYSSIKPPVSDFKPGPVLVEVGDRTTNALQLGATIAKGVGGKNAPSEQVKTPTPVMSTVGSMSGTANNAINVLDTFESGARAIKGGLTGNMPSAMPSTVVGKTVGKLVPGLNVLGTVSSLSNTKDVFSNPNSTTAQKTHAVIDSATSVLASVPIPKVALAGTLLNVVNSAFTPSSTPPSTNN
ncbi:hypothetical protein A176_001334 [Myxococcus hansupus]|uniref:Uncharacterized protein n=1 Tax=Pseudomyxococcus hansupus TaxID=1297742 RepID=A0A0H4X969_9BACT|nr:hypothetical protein [Myxococcus hansupus]AKQ64422.1 hypothetical protein A176_001334 [Myxococcus hansupus]